MAEEVKIVTEEEAKEWIPVWADVSEGSSYWANTLLTLDDNRQELPPLPAGWSWEGARAVHRVKRLRIPYTMMLQAVWFNMTNLPRMVEVFEGPELPPDVQVISVHEDHYFRTFDILIAHPSFEPVLEGMPAPDFLRWSECQFRVVEIPQASPTAS